MKSKIKFDAGSFVIDHLNTIVFAVLVLGLVLRVSIYNPLFVTNVSLDLIKRVGAYLLIAIGSGTILMVGGADLSAGRIMGICALISSALLQNVDAVTKVFPNLAPMSVVVVLFIALFLGAVISAINGIIVSGLNAPTFIVTLSTQLFIYGGMLVLLTLGTNGGQNISNLASEYKEFVTGGDLLPRYVGFSIAITFVLWIVYTFTPFGKNLRAVGTDREAAKASGINVMLITIIAFIVAGVLYGLSGFVEAARVGGPGASAGSGSEIDAIIACLIGGMSIKGGKGGIGGVVIGVIILQLMSICFQWMTISANYVYMIKGLMLCIAVIIDMISWKLKKVSK